jgi:hypothetical protein
MLTCVSENGTRTLGRLNASTTRQEGRRSDWRKRHGAVQWVETRVQP